MTAGGVAGRIDAGHGLRGWLLPRDRPLRRYLQLSTGLAVQGVGTGLVVRRARSV